MWYIQVQWQYFTVLVLASSDNFLSNKTALDEIKDQNTEYFVKKFINNIKEVDFVCDE